MPSDELGIWAEGRKSYVTELRRRCAEELAELERLRQESTNNERRVELLHEMDQVREKYARMERESQGSLF